MSLEHAIPKWVAQVLDDIQHAAGYDTKWVSTYESGGLVERDRSYETGLATITVKAVCEPCNTGWMSRMESRNKPLIEPMIRGEHVRLSVAEQVEVATWASKTAMVLEYHERGTVISD